MRLETLAEFGFTKDPFRSVHMETSDNLKVKRIVGMAIDSRAMISVIADRGYGKTRALDMAMHNRDVAVVKLMTSDKEKVLVGDIERAIIIELSSESVKRTREIRARQLRRILGEASRYRPVVLILEEAHRMHGQTLRSLKTMREMDWMGTYPLFTVILVGQYDPMRKRGVDEVRLRTDAVYMKGLTSSEITEYITATVGKCFQPDAIEAVSRLGNARNFLDLQEMLIALMSRALQVGQKIVSPLEVFEVYGGGIKEVMKKNRISLADIEEKTGISKTTLSLVSNEKQGTLTDDKFNDTRQAIASVLRARTQGKESQKKMEVVS